MGSFQVFYVTQGNLSSVYNYDQSQFCISFSPSESDNGNIRPELLVCEETEERGQVFTGIFYPVAIFVSCFFFFLTIVVFALLPELRCSLFSKITIGFLVNVFICYFFLGVRYSIEHSLDHLGGACIFLGYITHHTFISFFFWMSAMAINMTQKFSDIFKEETKDHGRPLLLNIAYAQVTCETIKFAYFCFLREFHWPSQQARPLWTGVAQSLRKFNTTFQFWLLLLGPAKHGSLHLLPGG